MSDIVERLGRTYVCEPECEGRCRECPQDVVNDAQTEIERLRAEVVAERAVSDRLLDALKRVVGDHNAPNDCYATGPLTGNTYQDLVACPSCQAESLIAEVEAMRKEKPE